VISKKTLHRNKKHWEQRKSKDWEELITKHHLDNCKRGSHGLCFTNWIGKNIRKNILQGLLLYDNKFFSKVQSFSSRYTLHHLLQILTHQSPKHQNIQKAK